MKKHLLPIVMLLFGLAACKSGSNENQLKEKTYHVFEDGLRVDKVSSTIDGVVFLRITEEVDTSRLRVIRDTMQLSDLNIVFLMKEGLGEFASITNNKVILKEKPKPPSEFTEESIASMVANIQSANAHIILSMDDIRILLLDLSRYQAYVRNMESSGDSIAVAKRNHVKTTLINVQKKLYPKLRTNYGKFCKNLLWEHDIEVSSNGTTITFTGGAFAANSNIKSFYGETNEMLHSLRYKRANFKWYKYDDEYTYFTIESPSDSSVD